MGESIELNFKHAAAPELAFQLHNLIAGAGARRIVVIPVSNDGQMHTTALRFEVALAKHREDIFFQLEDWEEIHEPVIRTC